LLIRAHKLGLVSLNHPVVRGNERILVARTTLVVRDVAEEPLEKCDGATPAPILSAPVSMSIRPAGCHH